MRKIIITEHDGGELANQLWNHVSVYAYALYRGVPCENWSFFEYGTFFTNLVPKNFCIRFFFRLFRHAGRRSAPRARLGRFLYKNIIARPIRLLSKNIILSTEANHYVYELPPAAPTRPELARLEHLPTTAFFAQVSGAVFRDRAGLERYRNELIEHFVPSAKTAAKASTALAPGRSRGAHVIGLHLRQSDFTDFKGGKFVISQARAREILAEFLQEHNFVAADCRVLICSDGPIDRNLFAGLDFFVSTNDAVTDLFSLAQCDAVIGSDSTFGHFAAWYGDIPHIIMKNEPMDWNYYRGKTKFFWNKYLTVATI